jgi:hypothetical protein
MKQEKDAYKFQNSIQREPLGNVSISRLNALIPTPARGQGKELINDSTLKAKNML